MESGGHGQRPLKGVASVKELCAAGRAEHLGFGGSDPAAVEAGMPIPQAQFVRIAGACERLTTSVCWVQSSLTGAPDMTPPPSAPTMKRVSTSAVRLRYGYGRPRSRTYRRPLTERSDLMTQKICFDCFDRLFPEKPVQKVTLGRQCVVCKALTDRPEQMTPVEAEDIPLLSK